MKKMICLFLALFLLCFICGCHAVPDTPADTSASTTGDSSSQTTTTTNFVSETDLRLPLIAVSTPVIQEITTRSDGSVLFTMCYQDISLIAPDAEAAENVVLGFLNQVDQGQAYAQEIQDLANEADPSDSSISYAYQLLYTPTRLDEKVLSFYGTEIGYSGGVHPNQVCMSANFDMVTGAFLSLEDVLTSSDAATDLSEQIIQQLTENRDTYQLYDGYESVIADRFSGNSSNWTQQTDWYFSDSGLCVFFSPYDLAPYVSGQILIEISYSQLHDILKNDFFPAELPASSGRISTALAQDVDLEQYTQFAEAILQTEGERFLLFSDGLVTNVRLEQGEWTEDGTVFTPSATVFYACTLCAGDAVMVQDQIPDVLPRLRLTYESAGTTVCCYISQSGKDGSILLIDPS